MDRLTIAGLKLHLRVGCTARERARPQGIEADVDLFLLLGRAGQGDDLRQSVDYAAVAEALRKELSPKVFKLAEAVAERAAAVVLGRFAGVRAVTVRVRKRALRGIRWAEVEISRSRRSPRTYPFPKPSRS